LSGSFILVRKVQPWEAFYEQSGFVPSKVEPAPVGFVQFCAADAAGLLVMAYRSDGVCVFRRVAFPPTQRTAGDGPDMAALLGNCKSAPIRCGGWADFADAFDQGRRGVRGRTSATGVFRHSLDSADAAVYPPAVFQTRRLHGLAARQP